MSDANDEGAEVTRHGIFDMQVCVPADWDDYAVQRFAECKYPCGTMAGWQIRKTGNPRLRGDGERVPCADRQGFVHIILEA